MHNRAIVALGVLLGAIMVAGTSSLVAADACVAQLGNSGQVNVQYYSVNSQIVVPVSTICSFFSGGQLYVVGSLFDTLTISNLGSANATLASVDGGRTFSGQLVFNIRPLLQGQSLRISAAIYGDGFNSLLLTSTSQTAQVFGANFFQPAYPWYYWYYPAPPYYPPYPHHP